MKSYFADQIQVFGSLRVFYAVINENQDLEYQKVDVRELDNLDNGLVFQRFQGTVPLFTVHSSY